MVILLFLTTGLRIGGLCRLRVPLARPIRAARDVPTELTTVEKNGRVRRVRLCNTCRILVARWYHRDRQAPPDSPFLFPARAPGGVSSSPVVSTRHVWNVCHRVFTRAGVSGSHVHPHAFRHTVIRMLYCQGMIPGLHHKCKALCVRRSKR